MNKKKLKKLIEIINKLSKEYNGFISVSFDNWRGFRFIFDTKETRKCDNNCKECPLYNLLKKEKIYKNNFGLIKATKNDKQLFGPQNFLNCKTLEQYENCFVNFILKECKTEKEIKDELNLVKDFKIVFSKNDSVKKIEKDFKKSVMNKLAITTKKRMG